MYRLCGIGTGLPSGVPQGSVLGPTLIIIFINDMPDVVNSMLLMFGDDTKLYRTIASVHDSNAFQQEIDSISTWGEQSLMSFNYKCHVMIFGRSQRHYSYTMKNADGIPSHCKGVIKNKIWQYCLLLILNLVNISVR